MMARLGQADMEATVSQVTKLYNHSKYNGISEQQLCP